MLVRVGVFFCLEKMDMTRTLIPYKKPYLSSAQLCQKLEEQGLIFDDKNFAEKVLSRCSYYRFKAYLSPFKDHSTKTFHDQIKFEYGHELYMFDSELRSYVFEMIAKVEIGVRSILDNWMTQKTKNAFWYLDSSLFQHNGKQVKTVSRVRDMFIDSKEEYASHYQNKYYNEYCPFYRDLPPTWVAIELMTFGNVVNLIDNISDEKVQEFQLDKMSKKLGVLKFQTLRNWMHVLHQLRNNCGHHNRIFNRNFPAPNGIKKKLQAKNIPFVRTRPNQSGRDEDQLNRIYTALAVLQCICKGLGFDEKMGIKISQLFDKYPTSQRCYESMGFPELWKNEPLFFT